MWTDFSIVILSRIDAPIPTIIINTISDQMTMINKMTKFVGNRKSLTSMWITLLNCDHKLSRPRLLDHPRNFLV